MKKSALFILLLLSGMAVHVQSQPQQIVATSGGNSQNGDISIEWTLGEPVIATLSNGSTNLTQGFHQPILAVTAIKTIDGLSFAVDAYPNPTNDLLLIKLVNTEARDFQFVLYDLNGKFLEQNYFVSDISAINMRSYPAGMYVLKVMHNKVIKTFEIVKN